MSYHNSMQQVTVKRKRGRPRLEDSVNNINLDVLIIQEFSARSCLYDRSAPNYRNRSYTEEQWREIAMTVGRSVGFVKERMVQLRNRFSTEKRRAESSDTSSPWKLYDFLTFLLPHVKNRGEVRERDITPPPTREMSNSSLDAMEHAASSNDEDDSEGNPYRKKYYHRSSHRHHSSKRVPDKRHTNQMRPSVIAGMRDTSDIPNMSASARSLHNGNRNGNIYGGFENNAAYENARRPQNNMGLHNKYVKVNVNPEPLMQQNQQESSIFQAFGTFVAKSLDSMDERRAFDIVAAFTAELSNALKDGVENYGEGAENPNIRGVGNSHSFYTQ